MFRAIVAVVIGLAGAALCLADSPPATQPVSPAFVGIDGKSYQPLSVEGHKAAVLVFILQDCPICNSYAPLIQRLANEYGPEGVAFYAVHVDATLAIADARKHAHDYAYTIPVLIDRKHELVQKLQIQAVPTAIVLSPDGQTAYHGRVDDLYFALGKPRNAATTSELKDAIAAVLDGKPVKKPHTHVIGCAVPDLPK